MKKNAGITLLALIITIIIMLILAGVTISIVGGSDGIIAKAEKAVSETDKAAMQEDAELAVAAIKMEYYEDYATNQNMTAKEFIVAQLQESDYETSRGAIMAADTAGNLTYKYNGVFYALTLADSGKVTFGESSSEPEEPSIPEGLAVGDTVSYSPSGTYTWDADYFASSVDYYDAELDSSTSDYKITSWKVLSIDETTGEVKLVPSAATTGEVTLQGAQGYNNAVKLLNDACSNLYGDSSKGISARSINYEDFEAEMSQETKDYMYDSLYAYAAANLTWLDENLQVKEAYTTNQKYPTIYEQEDLSVITYYGDTKETKVENEAGLGVSEQTTLIERDGIGAVSKDAGELGKITTATSIRPYLTWSVVDYQTAVSILGEKTSLLIPAGENTHYWVASRCVDAYSGRCGFDVRYMTSGGFNTSRLLNSGGETFEESEPLFPIITLRANLLEGDTTSGWSVK